MKKKKRRRVTVEKLRSYEMYKHLTDQQVEEYIDQLYRLSEIVIKEVFYQQSIKGFGKKDI